MLKLFRRYNKCLFLGKWKWNCKQANGGALQIARRGKTAKEIAEMFDRVDDFLKEDVANAIKEYMEGN